VKPTSNSSTQATLQPKQLFNPSNSSTQATLQPKQPLYFKLHIAQKRETSLHTQAKAEEQLCITKGATNFKQHTAQSIKPTTSSSRRKTENHAR
jgi:hypothetical protein